MWKMCVPNVFSQSEKIDAPTENHDPRSQKMKNFRFFDIN